VADKVIWVVTIRPVGHIPDNWTSLLDYLEIARNPRFGQFDSSDVIA
jgi:hypothetical protein